jgi:hypothetical protein
MTKRSRLEVKKTLVRLSNGKNKMADLAWTVINDHSHSKTGQFVWF